MVCDLSRPQTDTRDTAPDWFRIHIQPHEAPLRSYLRARYSLHDVDDIVQEAFLRVWKARGGGDPIRQPKAFLFRTARNLVVDGFRRRMSSRIVDITRSAACEVPDDQPHIADALHHQQNLTVLRAAIQQLPPRCRLVIELRYFQKIPTDVIAARMGISPHTVNAHVALATRHCARSMLGEMAS